MPSSFWPSSPLAAAQRAFDLLTCPPAPLAFDGRVVQGLPARQIPLRELRQLLLTCSTAAVVRDAAWRELVLRARRDGPTWVVAATGVALPGLRRAAGRLAAGWHGDTADLDAEMIVGFVARLHSLDVAEPRICGRLIDAGQRAARRFRERNADVDVVPFESDGPRVPLPPFDHPDLVLARAVAAGVLDAEEANLIGATRIGHATLAQAAAEFGIGAALAASWRRSAEKRLVAAIHDGELDYVTLLPRRRRNRHVVVGRQAGQQRPVGVATGTQQGPLVSKAVLRPGVAAGAPGWEPRPA